ncbi:hypothetical protein T5B8_06146 [Salinisphaera sp. T5B8]|uniref:thermostable hemolysin n=1 Tax=Salinisphaera sp. T5B8 TaxID=1304154 RepID=UPI0033425854
MTGRSKPIRGPWLRYYQPQTCGRSVVERFAADQYALHYSAQVAEFYPHQLALFDNQGLRACLGFRTASDGPLFLEQYLQMPVERAIGGRLGPSLVRSHIVEVGGLAADWAGAGRRLIVMAIAWLHGAGYSVAAFTATRGLVNSFIRLGMSPLDLGSAEPGRLMPADTDWGRYYAHAPRVYAGLIGASAARTLPAACQAQAC